MTRTTSMKPAATICWWQTINTDTVHNLLLLLMMMTLLMLTLVMTLLVMVTMMMMMALIYPRGYQPPPSSVMRSMGRSCGYCGWLRVQRSWTLLKDGAAAGRERICCWCYRVIVTSRIQPRDRSLRWWASLTTSVCPFFWSFALGERAN